MSMRTLCSICTRSLSGRQAFSSSSSTSAVAKETRPVEFRNVGRRMSARAISTSASLQSGSNKWSKIRHKKAANDAAKSAAYGVLSREIISAVKNFGGPDPALNYRLGMLLTKARELDVPKDKVEQTLAKAAGKDSVDLQTVTYEALGPVTSSHPPVALIIECMTDNTRRTMASLKEAFNKSGGSRLSSTSHLFERTGYIRLQARSGATFDEIFEAAVEGGAEDVQLVEDDSIESAPDGVNSSVPSADESSSSRPLVVEIKCSPSDVHALAGVLSSAPHHHVLKDAEQRMEPTGPLLCFEEDQAHMSPDEAAGVAGWVSESYWERLEKMRDMIESNADCQRIFSNLAGWPSR